MKLIRATNEWLAEKLKERRMSQAELARLLRRQPAQISHWIHGQEKIPVKCLLEIAFLLAPEDQSYIAILRSCDALATHLKNDLETLPRETFDGLSTQLETLVCQEADTQEARVALTVQYLTTAAFVARTATVPNHDYLISPETVGRHLLYPANYFLQFLITSQYDTKFSDSAQESLSMVVNRSKEPEWAAPACYAIARLARVGSENTRRNIRYTVDSNLGSLNLLLQFQAINVITSTADRTLIQRYLNSLKKNAILVKLYLLIAALHYGDTTLDKQGRFPDKCTGYTATVSHLLRHLEHPDIYGDLLDLDSFILTKLLTDYAGPEPFRKPHVLPRLRRLLFDKAEILTDRSPLQKELRHQFARLIG